MSSDYMDSLIDNLLPHKNPNPELSQVVFISFPLLRGAYLKYFRNYFGVDASSANCNPHCLRMLGNSTVGTPFPLKCVANLVGIQVFLAEKAEW